MVINNTGVLEMNYEGLWHEGHTWYWLERIPLASQ